VEGDDDDDFFAIPSRPAANKRRPNIPPKKPIVHVLSDDDEDDEDAFCVPATRPRPKKPAPPAITRRQRTDSRSHEGAKLNGLGSKKPGRKNQRKVGGRKFIDDEADVSVDQPVSGDESGGDSYDEAELSMIDDRADCVLTQDPRVE
jgi:hypothetical protein